MNDHPLISAVDVEVPVAEGDKTIGMTECSCCEMTSEVGAPAVRRLVNEVRGGSKINNSHPLINACKCLSAGGMGTTTCLAEMLLL